MRIPVFLSKVLGFLLAVLAALFSWFPSDWLGANDEETAALKEKTGGFIAGVCHPNLRQTDLMLEANLNWVRMDLPFPYMPDGSPNPIYEMWVEGAKEYIGSGIKIFAVTPYPKDYLLYGLDIRNEADIPAIQDIARKYATDFAGSVSAFQITNEMGVPRFTEPYSMDDAARFIGVQMEAMAPLKGNVPVGYNLGGAGLYKLPLKMAKYNEYCDFVGVDLYLGSFENITKNFNMNFEILNLVRLVTQKPIILTEFGYMGSGEPKTRAEKNEILRGYGFANEKEARADIDTFISRLPKKLRNEFTRLYGDRSDKEKGDLLFKGEYANHIYCELTEGTGLYGYPHTPEGQAKYFKEMLTRLREIDWCAGAFIYMWHDSSQCYVCGQKNCPVETGWGLVDRDGNPKPAYYAVKEALG